MIIAGVSSGVGKTTVTLALLSCLMKRGLNVQSFKVGPDYIDPMFHYFVTGKYCRNLDPFLTSDSYVKECFYRHIENVNYTVIEGVMGLFDGVKISDHYGDFRDNYFASTAYISQLLNLPVILVIDCSKLSGSVAAIAHGYASLIPNINMAGVILNRVGSDRHLELLKSALDCFQIPILGVFKREININIPSRHLGLIPTGEINELNILIDRLAHLGESCFNWDLLLPLLQCAKFNPHSLKEEEKLFNYKSCKIAVAYDQAFNFYYQDNLDILTKLGAELIFWSPLKDRLPKNVDKLYFGGGFPEVFAEELATNILGKEDVKKAILKGIPTYAECGGLMYLSEEIINFTGYSYPMVGVLPTTAKMSDRLILGYRKGTSLQNSCMMKLGQIVKGHEFHKSYLTKMPEKPVLQLAGYGQTSEIKYEGWQKYNLHCSYLHLHWGNQLELVKKFINFTGDNREV